MDRDGVNTSFHRTAEDYITADYNYFTFHQSCPTPASWSILRSGRCGSQPCHIIAAWILVSITVAGVLLWTGLAGSQLNDPGPALNTYCQQNTLKKREMNEEGSVYITADGR